MTDNLSDQVPTDIVQTQRSLQTKQLKTYTSTFKERDVIHIKPDEPFTNKSKKLTFHIKPQVDRAFNPTDMYLRLPMKLAPTVSGNGLAPLPGHIGKKRTSAGSITSISSGKYSHTRFRNPAHVHLIKKVQILPNRQNDIEDQDE